MFHIINYPISLFKLIYVILLATFPICLHCEEFKETPIKAVVFDLGGVVVEADRNKVISFISCSFDLSEQEATKVMKQLESHWINGGKEKEFWDKYAFENGKVLPSDWHLQWQYNLTYSIQPIPGTIEIIQELKAQGFVVALLSNVRKKLAEYIQQLGYYDLFEPTLLSCEIGFEKPDPRSYEVLLSELKLPPNVCLFIDDRIENVEAARKLGVDSIQFFNSQQLKEELAQRDIFILK